MRGGDQPAYSLHTCRYHHNSGNQAHPYSQNTPKVHNFTTSPYLESYVHKADAKSHPSSICPMYNTHIHNTHHFFNCTHIRTTVSPLDLRTDPAGVTALLARWTEKLAGRPQTVISDPPPPLPMVMGIQQQPYQKTINR